MSKVSLATHSFPVGMNHCQSSIRDSSLNTNQNAIDYGSTLKPPISNDVPQMPPQSKTLFGNRLPGISNLVGLHLLAPKNELTTPPQQPPSEMPEREMNFESLVQIILQHPLFPLVFKGAYEVCTATSPKLPDPHSEMVIEFATNECKRLRELACNPESQSKLSEQGVDLFLVALHTALDALKAPTQPIPAPLHSMMKACENPPVLSKINVSKRSPSSSSSTPISPSFLEHRKPKLSEKAKRILESWFYANYDNPYPDDETKQWLAEQCNLELKQINNYFSNRRMRAKRKILEQKAKEKAQFGSDQAHILDPSGLGAHMKWKAIVKLDRGDTQSKHDIQSPIDTFSPGHTGYERENKRRYPYRPW